MQSYNQIQLSIVIPCAYDLRLARCLKSIDEDVEVIVVLNGATEAVRQIVINAGVASVEMPERNLSKSLNVGAKAAKNNAVLFIDSDCVFEPGAIRKMYAESKKSPVVKGMVVFESSGFISRTIAKVRDFVNYNSPKPYNPFLLLNKSIVPLVGGYLFDEQIYWTEDADLYVRLKQANIAVSYNYDARAFHPELSLFYDLRSGFRYGIGKRIRVELKKAQGMGTSFVDFFAITRKKGIVSGVYLLVWNIFYSAGYLFQAIRDPYGVHKNSEEAGVA